MIVNDICKIIGWIAVGLNQNLIIKLLVLYGYFPVNRIGKSSRSLLRNILPDNIGNS